MDQIKDGNFMPVLKGHQVLVLFSNGPMPIVRVLITVINGVLHQEDEVEDAVIVHQEVQQEPKENVGYAALKV